MSMSNIEQICKDENSRKYRKFLKQIKHRSERRRAKRNPECFADYKKYRGYSM